MRYAWRGLVYAYTREQNIRIQTFVALFVIAVGALVGLQRNEWVVIGLLISLVLILEILNSVLERFIDVVKPRYHEQVQIVKDMLAAMVFLAALTATIIGLIIFWPYFIELLAI